MPACAPGLPRARALPSRCNTTSRASARVRRRPLHPSPVSRRPRLARNPAKWQEPHHRTPMTTLIAGKVDTVATIQKVISEELDVAIGELDPLRPLDELGVDSLGIIEVMFMLEE